MKPTPAMALLGGCLISSVLAFGAQAQIISINFDNNLDLGSALMESTDLAGAPGVRVGNWNPWLKNDFTLGDAGQTIVDDSGSTIAGLTATISVGWASRNNNDVNDTAMFSDIVDVQTSTRLVDVFNIPYALYDVYVYMYDDRDARAGEFVLGGTTYYARGLSPAGGPEGLANPASDGTGYILSSDTTYGLGTDIDMGNYVRFSNVSGADIQMEWTAVFAGDSTQRAKVAGFQIVQVPEPTAFALAGLGLAGLLIRRRMT